MENFVGLLEQALWVDTSENTVSIGIHFPDRDLAFSLVETAQRNFLEAREAAEIAMITDAITILEGRAAQSAETTAAALVHLQQTRASRLPSAARTTPVAIDAALLKPIDREGARLTAQLESRRRALTDLEEARRQRVNEMESGSRSSGRPSPRTTPPCSTPRQTLDTVRQESPEMAALRREIRRAGAGAARPGAPQRRAAADGAHPRRGGRGDAGLHRPREDLDPDIDYAKSELRHAVARHNAMLDRVEAARLELDSARAAFKYRYAVINPPQKPKGPVKPDARW